MRYLVTGGGGFIGSHLAERLIEQGHQVTAVDNLSTGQHRNIAHLEGNGLTLVVGSVTDEGLVRELVKDADAVFHLASAVGVRLIIDQPVKTIETIINGTELVLRACSRYRRRVLLTSTSEVYGKGTEVPFAEGDDHVLGSTTKRRWSYATAKMVDEFLALAHWHETGLPVVIVRLFNTVGPRQTGRYGMVIPSFVEQGLRGEPITVYGDGSQSRCFCHVRDAVKGMVALMERPEAAGQVFNVGNDSETTILELAEKVQGMTGGRSEIVLVPYDEAYTEGFEDMQRRVPDLTKIAEWIGYEPQYSLEDILRDVIEYVSNESGPAA